MTFYVSLSPGTEHCLTQNSEKWQNLKFIKVERKMNTGSD